jgi:hypothetical protein
MSMQRRINEAEDGSTISKSGKSLFKREEALFLTLNESSEA